MAPTTIHRIRLERWLRSHAQTPVRLLIAPAGSGKSSLLLKYAADAPTDVAYCALHQGCTLEEFRALVARALGYAEQPDSYEALLQLICGSPARCIELLVDDAGDGADGVVEELHRLVEDVSENVSLLYAARCLDRINARRLIARGLAEICDARRLAFDEEDARMLAEVCGIECTDRDLSRLVNDTDGWALALCAATRIAAADGEKLDNAYERWRSESASFLNEFLASELERVPEDQAQLFRTVLAGTADAQPGELRALKARGLFIFDEGDDMLRPYRALRPKPSRAVHEPARVRAPLMAVRMFGAFEAKIEGREIAWVRKRDQQIVKYLLLKPDGRATRKELIDTFWSGTDHHLATQSMRTAFSTIRRAIALVVGYDAVESYFRTAPDVQIVLQHVLCDVRRFTAHVSDGEDSFERNDLKDAAFHYRAADKIYAGALLEYDAPESWFAAHARSLHERELLLLERLSDIALEHGERSKAREYAMRAAAMSPDQLSVAKLLERTREQAAEKVTRGSLVKESTPAAVSGRLLETAG